MTTWTVLVPVRRRDGKSRLGAEVPREALTLAMAEDVVGAARACPQVARVVMVVADDADVDWLAGPLTGTVGSQAAPCEAHIGGDGLNEDLGAAASSFAPTAPVAVVMADLAGLRPADLAPVLTAAAGVPRGVVADAGGTGTAVLLARQGRHLAPRFGAGSFARHRADGASDLTGHAGLPVRLDVDTPGDLQRLRAGEVEPGPATTALLAK